MSEIQATSQQEIEAFRLQCPLIAPRPSTWCEANILKGFVK